MKKSKIPDNVVFNEKTQQFDAALRPYGTNLVAPMINPSDTVAWKNRCINKLNHKIKYSKMGKDILCDIDLSWLKIQKEIKARQGTY